MGEAPPCDGPRLSSSSEAPQRPSQHPPCSRCSSAGSLPGCSPPTRPWDVGTLLPPALGLPWAGSNSLPCWDPTCWGGAGDVGDFHAPQLDADFQIHQGDGARVGGTGGVWQGEPFGAKFNQCCPNSLQGCKILLVWRGLGNEDVASASGASRPPPSPWQPMPGDAEGQSPGLGAQGGRRAGWGHGQGGEGRGAVRTPGSRLQHSARSRWV